MKNFERLVALRQLLDHCLQACTEASYLEFRKKQLSQGSEARSLGESEDASTHPHASIRRADWTASLQSSAPATTPNLPNLTEVMTANGSVSVPTLTRLAWISGC